MTRRKHRWRWIALGVLALLMAVGIGARLYLNTWLPDYVNTALSRIKGYQGSVEDIDIALYRGAYRIHGLKIDKKTGNIPTPFFAAETIDLSIQWSALLHGRVVSDVHLTRPVLNFAVNKSGTAKQTGAGVDWTKTIQDLMPIDINLVTVDDGKITYQDFSTTPKVNVYMHHLTGEARNLRNVVDKAQPLPSTISAKGDSIGGGALSVQGRMNILKPVPDMDLDLTLENVNLAALSDYSNAYASVDIKGGKLNVYSEFIVRDSHVSGYVKPIATDISLIDMRKNPNPLKLAWEALVSVVVEIFTNQSKDQFATKIPLEGDLGEVNTDTWSAVGGIIRNAFVKALKGGIDADVTFGKAKKAE